jgi:phosphotransacetylase
VIVAQDPRFEGRVQVGDELVATVTTREKGSEGRFVVFDCRVENQGRELIAGTVTVRAPDRHLRYADIAVPEIVLRHNDQYVKLLGACENLPRVTCAVLHSADRDSLLGAIQAARRGLIEPVLVGSEAKIRAAAQAADVDLSRYRVVTTEHSHAAAEKAVAMARAGEVEALMKGSLHTDELMGAVVPSEKGLRTARRITHAFVLDVPVYPRPLMVTDAAINIVPTLKDKADIAQNAIDLAHVLGIEAPKVAILSARAPA